MRVRAFLLAGTLLLLLPSVAEVQRRPEPKADRPRLHLMRVTQFRINNGAESTPSLAVTLNNSAEGDPTHWRASEASNFTGAGTRHGLYERAPAYTLSPEGGEKTVYFQVGKLQDGTIFWSATARDTIQYSPPEPRVTYVIKGGEAYETARSRRFEFTARPLDVASSCRIDGTIGTPLDIVAWTSRVLGSKCDFTLFGGRQLKAGWTFKSYTQHVECSPPKRGYSVTRQPSAGGRDLTFNIRLWADAPGTIVGEPDSTRCRFEISDITLAGPSALTWRAAFD